ncbi:efflux RND transporter periplasmic adaptor subunit [Gilvimarinus xylanilyticus]|uniref:Efflux RND transporter periplasmic adaptor subunit n=1 Tax=Gilvimarinus xylanilyticus TaxID=2944139 RepID=A0A9X2I2W4_9GAMM|nr:efflux RND transporter periplasmic adaptor subunit [Gilvimarinus xylanilyticus]MCP8899330.1 efflux RND transporter periplasmic adaptor subunit [Gilvimarinus xylanilyticus]
MALLSACGKSSDAPAGAGGAGSAPPQEVTVVTLKEQAVDLSAELPGRAVAYRKAEVRPQVTGIIEKRLFTEGAYVEAGQQLYQIDAARYEAAVANAKAQVTRAKANLSTTEARQKRYENLLSEKAVSQQDYDDALFSYESAQADLAVAEAALRTAEIDLRYTEVNAPISGRIGISSVTEGALVSAQQAAVLTTINQLDPIYVDVSQSAGRILQIRRDVQNGVISRDETPKVQLVMEDGTEYPHQGEMQFSDVSVNESTGTVVVRALFPNPDSMLMPGMFVRAHLAEGERSNAVLVPQRAVRRDREGNASVMTVNAEGVVEPRPIEASRSVGSDWLVESGLSAGDKVIVAGLQKIRPGAPVTTVEAGSAQGE